VGKQTPEREVGCDQQDAYYAAKEDHHPETKGSGFHDSTAPRRYPMPRTVWMSFTGRF
jgi:hypothetical protein